MRRRTLLFGAGALAVGATAGGVVLTGVFEPEEDEPHGQVRIATGSRTGVYYAYGSALAGRANVRLTGVQASVITTAASDENVQLVLSGGAEIGFTQADIAGKAEALGPGRLAALARVYDDYLHLVVRADAGIRSLADLRGHRVSVGAAGSGTGITAERVFSVIGSDFAEQFDRVPFNLDDSASALRAGSIDAFFFSGGLPVPQITELATLLPVQLVALPDLAPLLREQFGPYYAERLVPASTYADTRSTATIGIANYLVVRRTMAEPLGYAMTRLLFDERSALAKAHPAGDRLNIRSAISTPPLPLHAGAVRYYRQTKE